MCEKGMSRCIAVMAYVVVWRSLRHAAHGKPSKSKGLTSASLGMTAHMPVSSSHAAAGITQDARLLGKRQTLRHCLRRESEDRFGVRALLTARALGQHPTLAASPMHAAERVESEERLA